ncbi:MAG: PIG-L deacetylase family protein [Heliomarina sp.]|uniref:PIG-L deacetylase family protein n=1 Tax=Heliomarina sp. TaxID=2917556 RepID=UPI004058D790
MSKLIADITGPIVVLAPHPDDESLGCGALLAHAFRGAGAHVICMTDGAASHPGSRIWTRERLANRRRAEMEAALVALGGSPSDLTWLGLPDAALGDCDHLIVAARICAIIRQTGAGALFATAVEDHHADHKATAAIAAQVATLCPDVPQYRYPVWSRWDDPHFDEALGMRNAIRFSPGRHGPAKRAAVFSHASQMGQCVDDDPLGFQLDPRFVEKFILEDEIYWRQE